MTAPKPPLALLIFLGGLLMFGCSAPKERTVSGIEIRDKKADVPAFAREYVTKINGNVTLTITIKRWSSGGSGVYTTGELTQSNGRWVMFEPESPADKILDRELLPIVEKYCDEILRIDKEFRKSNPQTFTDEDGVTWKRQ